MKPLLYFTIFLNEEPIKWLELLLISMKLFSEPFDILVMTSENLLSSIRELSESLQIMILPCETLADCVNHRFKIFDYNEIHKYSKILYMDTDILVQNDLSILFNIPIEDKIYALIEFNKTIESEHHGQTLFDFTKVDKHTPGRNAGVLLFQNTPTIKTLFSTLVDKLQNINIISPDQQLLNYLCVTQNLFGDDILKEYVFLTYTHYPVSPLINSKLIMNHFYGTMKRKTKIQRMKDHMRYLLHLYISRPENISNRTINRRYSWNNGFITFKSENELITHWGNGSYRCISENIYDVTWNNIKHIMIFNTSFTKYVAIQINTTEITYG